MKIQIPFRDVLQGEHFYSSANKRAFGGLKIKEVRASTQEHTFVARAVILTDHVGEKASDAGCLIGFELEEIVEVER